METGVVTAGFQDEGESISGEGVLDSAETDKHYNMNRAGSAGIDI